MTGDQFNQSTTMKLNQIANKFFQLLGLASIIFVVAFVCLYIYFEQVVEAVNELEHIYDNKITIVNRADGNEAENRDNGNSEVDEPVGSIEISDCYTAVDYWTKELGIEGQVPLIKKIVKAESNNNSQAKNPNSTASSCSQFLWSTWHSQGLKYWGDDFYNKNIWNPSDNVELMVRMIRDGGLSHWSASEHSWQ